MRLMREPSFPPDPPFVVALRRVAEEERHRAAEHRHMSERYSQPGETMWFALPWYWGERYEAQMAAEHDGRADVYDGFISLIMGWGRCQCRGEGRICVG